MWQRALILERFGSEHYNKPAEERKPVMSLSVPAPSAIKGVKEELVIGEEVVGCGVGLRSISREAYTMLRQPMTSMGPVYDVPSQWRPEVTEQYGGDIFEKGQFMIWNPL